MRQIDTFADELPPARMRAVALLLEGRSISATAEQVGVDRATLHRWLRDPAFQATLNSEKLAILAQTRAELSNLAGEAVRVIRESLSAQFVPRPVRLKAAMMVLKMMGADTPEAIGPTDPREIELARLEPDREPGDQTMIANYVVSLVESETDLELQESNSPAQLPAPES